MTKQCYRRKSCVNATQLSIHQPKFDTFILHFRLLLFPSLSPRFQPSQKLTRFLQAGRVTVTVMKQLLSCAQRVGVQRRWANVSKEIRCGECRNWPVLSGRWRKSTPSPLKRHQTPTPLCLDL